MSFEFRVPNYARAVGARMDYVPFASRLLWAGGFQMNIMPELVSGKRTQPIFSYNPRQVTLKETLVLPAGYSARKLPDDRKAGGEVAWIKGGWKHSGNTLEFNRGLARARPLAAGLDV